VIKFTCWIFFLFQSMFFPQYDGASFTLTTTKNNMKNTYVYFNFYSSSYQKGRQKIQCRMAADILRIFSALNFFTNAVLFCQLVSKNTWTSSHHQRIYLGSAIFLCSMLTKHQLIFISLNNYLYSNHFHINASVFSLYSVCVYIQ